MTMLQVEAHDPYGRFTTASVNITVLDVNDNIPVIETRKMNLLSRAGCDSIVCEKLLVYHNHFAVIHCILVTRYPQNEFGIYMYIL